jgi:galactokinase
LRDVSVEEFNRYHNTLPEVIRRRCRHVVYENQRVEDAVDALQKGDAARFGELLYQSHESLKDDYQVSCQELDEMVKIAKGEGGVYGGRMTGAGFGGCTVNLVRRDALDSFVNRAKKDYPSRTGIEPHIYVCRAEDGVKLEFQV